MDLERIRYYWSYHQGEHSRYNIDGTTEGEK